MQRRLVSDAGLVALVLGLCLLPLAAQSAEKKKVIFDQDHEGVIGGNGSPLVMLLAADNVEVLGVTVGTGNGWLKQEVEDALKTLEITGREDIPVYAGAEFPLVDTREEMLLRHKLYGGHRLDPFLGAYAEGDPGPDVVKPPPGGYAKNRPAKGHAAEFIVKTIRENPGEVILYCGGALTNVALAISIAPDIVPLTKELVFMGTSPHRHSRTVNVIYDPEAAKIALRAPWPKVTLVTVDIAEKVHMSIDLARAVANGKNEKVAELHRKNYIERYERNPDMSWFRMPDEMTAAYIIDPTIFTEVRRMYVDIDTTPGINYGGSQFWDVEPRGYGGRPWPENPGYGAQKPTPTTRARIAHVLWELDKERFKELFVDLMTRPLPED